MNKLIWPLLLAVLLFAPAAFAGDFLIVPGQRIGTVTLGMDRASVHTLLHAPSTTHQAHGMVLDTWLSHGPAASPDARYSLKHDYLTVFFRNNHAVQMEVSAAKFKTASGLSTRNSARAFEKQYPNHQAPHFADDPLLNWGNFHYNEAAVDPDASSPAAKHYLYYGEALLPGEARNAKTLGISWKYGAWGDMAPDPDPNGPLEAVIVQIPGNAVLLNPNDGRPYSGTGPARK